MRVELVGTQARVTPVLMGDAIARDIASGKDVRLNLTDPDSMTVAPNGNVVLVSQADSEIVYLHNAGLKDQTVSRLRASTQLDDTVWASESDGLFYVVDSKANTIYIVRGALRSDVIYTEAPSDSSIPGIVATINPQTGSTTPVIEGFESPTGLIFVGDRDTVLK